MNPYHARSQAEALIKQLRISEPPIDVEDLAKRLGLNVLYEELGGEDVSGALVRTKEGANVLV